MYNGNGNLVKFYNLNRDTEEPRVIDANGLMEEKLERIRYIMPDANLGGSSDDYGYDEGDGEGGGFSEGLPADSLDALFSEGYEGEYDEEGNPISNVIKAAPEEEGYYDEQPEYNQAPEYNEQPVYDGPSPEEIIESAKAEAESIRIAAYDEIEREKSMGYEEGKASGYAEGMEVANAEVDAIKRSLEDERRALEEQYESRIVDLEPQFVHALTQIYERVFDVDLSEEKNLVTSLLHNTMMRIEGCKNYLIHVSRDDYAYVSEHRSELVTESMPEDITIDIVEDAMMKAGDCMIETSNGIFDCGLGTQLLNLRRKLELLSYSVK